MNPHHVDILIYVIIFVLPFAISSLFHSRESYFPVLVIVSVFILFFISSILMSYRELEGDSLLYSNLFSRAVDADGFFDFIVRNRAESGFLILIFILANIGLSYQFLFFIVPVIFCYCYYTMIKESFINYKSLLLLVSFLLVLTPFFYSLNGNVIRQALCSGFLFLTYRGCQKKHYGFAMISSLLAGMFHSIGYFGLVCIVYNRFFDFKLSYWVALLFLISLSSYIGVFSDYIGLLFNSLDSEYYHAYGEGTHAYYRLGFRLDFFLMNLLPFFAMFLLNLNINNKDKVIINISCIWSLLHIASFSIPYSDRIGVNSWILYPVILGLLVKYKFGKL